MRILKGIMSALLTLVIICGVLTVAAADTDISVEPIAFNNPDFIRGMDVSSVLSLEASGVRFSDHRGAEQDIFRILADNGVNYIRVRVWNDPFNAQGRGYGGGNSDVSAACKIGARAARYGMKLLVDFHYSDFWADPGKQKAPKAWSGMTVSQKSEAIYDYTYNSLKEISASGADIGMAQIGNEINTGIAGEYDIDDVAELLKSGIRAVKDFDGSVLTAVHFTDPEKTDYIKSLADRLGDYDVDYDVFALSYYPYWHGSLDNLTHVLSYVADTYGKYAMVAETSYANTLEDTDGHANTVSYWSNNTGDDLLWSFTPQGQADELRAVMAAVNAVGDRGLGVFYWEGAWISVGDTTGLSGSAYQSRLEANRGLWESYGSGWASSYSAEFDPDDAGKWYGGSAVDNQALFDAHGKALSSLKVFSLVSPESYKLGDADGNSDVDTLDATCVLRYSALIPLKVKYNSLRHADVNSDGEIDTVDATLIQRYSTRVSTPYPIGAYVS